MINKYFEYSNPETKKEILNAGSNTIIVFSRLEKIAALDPIQVDKLSQIFSLLQDRMYESEDIEEDSESLFGCLVDAFGEESYFVSVDDHDVEPRNLKIIEPVDPPSENDTIMSTFNAYSDETLIAFGYLNSKDLYLTSNDLELLTKHLRWFVNESNRCKPETAVFVDLLISMFEAELKAIKNKDPYVQYLVLGL